MILKTKKTTKPKGDKMNKEFFLCFLKMGCLFLLTLQLSSCASRGARQGRDSLLSRENVSDLTSETTEEDDDDDLEIDDLFDEAEDSSKEDGSSDLDFEEDFEEEKSFGSEEEEDSFHEEEGQDKASDLETAENLEEEFDEELDDGLEENQDVNTTNDFAEEESSENFEEESIEDFSEAEPSDKEFKDSAVNPSPSFQEKDQQDEKSYSEGEDVSQKQKTLLSSQGLTDFLLSPNPPAYIGKKISIELRDTDIRDAFELVTLESGLNMVLSDAVQGRVSLKLKDVPWDQAFVMLLRVKNLGYIRYGNVLQISPQSMIDQELSELKRRAREESRREEEDLKSERGGEEEKGPEVLPLKMHVVSLQFSKASSIQEQISLLLTENRGSVSAHTRTNSLIIKDTEEALKNIFKLIKILDIPPPQVLIEGKFVEATEDFQKEFGMRWGNFDSGRALNYTSSIAGRGEEPVSIGGNFSVSPVVGKNIAGAFSSFLNIGTFKFLGDFGAELALSEKDDKVNVISSPRIVVMNNESAVIQQTGESIFTTTVRVLGTDSVEEKVQKDPVKLELKVTPQITLEGSVSLEIDIVRQFVGGSGTGARPINTRSAKTKVLIKDGHSAFIGGIYQKDSGGSSSGVPLLSSIPIFGWLFKGVSKKYSKNELWIFLTPKILQSQGDDLEDIENLDLDDEDEEEEQFASSLKPTKSTEAYKQRIEKTVR